MDDSPISSAADFWRFVDTFGEIYTEDTYELKGPTKNSIPKGLVFFLHRKTHDINSVVNTLTKIAEKKIKLLEKIMSLIVALCPVLFTGL